MGMLGGVVVRLEGSDLEYHTVDWNFLSHKWG